MKYGTLISYGDFIFVIMCRFVIDIFEYYSNLCSPILQIDEAEPSLILGGFAEEKKKKKKKKGKKVKVLHN